MKGSLSGLSLYVTNVVPAESDACVLTHRERHVHTHTHTHTNTRIYAHTNTQLSFRGERVDGKACLFTTKQGDNYTKIAWCVAGLMQDIYAVLKHSYEAVALSAC